MTEQETIQKSTENMDALPSSVVVGLSFPDLGSILPGGVVRVALMVFGRRPFRLVGVEQIAPSPRPGVVARHPFELVDVGRGKRSDWPSNGDNTGRLELEGVAGMCVPLLDGLVLEREEMWAIWRNCERRPLTLQGRFLGQLLDVPKSTEKRGPLGAIIGGEATR